MSTTELFLSYFNILLYFRYRPSPFLIRNPPSPPDASSHSLSFLTLFPLRFYLCVIFFLSLLHTFSFLLHIPILPSSPPFLPSLPHPPPFSLTSQPTEGFILKNLNTFLVSASPTSRQTLPKHDRCQLCNIFTNNPKKIVKEKGERWVRNICLGITTNLDQRRSEKVRVGL